MIFLSLGALLYQYVGAKNITDFGTADQLFTTVALQYANPFIASFFIIGLVAAAYSSADSALTALTTSFCVDFLGFERNKTTNLKTRRLVHIGFAFIFMKAPHFCVSTITHFFVFWLVKMPVIQIVNVGTFAMN